jgi:AAA15 family ATPase/GTPase
MLITAKISNFLSIGKLQEICMTSGKVRAKREHLYRSKYLNLLRLSIIYGSNAAGKSNLISALEFAQQVIVKEIPRGYTTKYNRTEEGNIDRPSHFEFEIHIDEKYYSYGFEIILNKGSITSEWLYENFSNGNNKKIFERNLSDDKFYLGKHFTNKSLKNRLEIYFEDTKYLDKVLFLSEMNRNKSDLYKKENELRPFRDVFKWFKTNLDINYPDKLFSDYSYFMQKAHADEICEKIRIFGTGITDFSIIDAKREDLSNKVPQDVLNEIFEKLEERISDFKKDESKEHPSGALLRGERDFYIFEINDNCDIEIKTIEFKHSNCGTFSLSEESDGTRRILELIEILFSENNDKVYVIDEIERSLHPLMTRKFIECYLNTLKERNVQLIVTTHETGILDLSLIRRDEVWFMNKNGAGNSELYSLEQFNERFDRNVQKAYLSGRYAAIPSFEEE